MAYYKTYTKKKDFGPRKNEWIKAPTVQVITDDGDNLGEMKIKDALVKAQELELDLVEVGAKAKPPVCKIMDYSKYLYQQKKKQRANKVSSKQKDMKEFKFSPVIDIGDINTRVRRALDYLEKGHPVRITMFRKGRQSSEQAKQVFNEILTNFTEYSSIEADPKREGRNMFITFYKKNGKTKNK
ncbi:translation initiation factor IF-3 [bacterium]|nr:translation initiation factor IF-3 [bacterium]